MQPLTLLGQMIRRKLGAGPEPRDMFRPSMFLSLSAIPFLLSDEATHIASPPIDGADIKTNIGNIAYVDCDGLRLTRLYVPEIEARPGCFQIELDDQGGIAECRFFRELDSVYPATEDEWFQWVNPYWDKPVELDSYDPAYARAAEVAQILPMIGHPEFQLTDGTLYGRHWSQGDYSVEPFLFTETEIGAGGAVVARRNRQAMLYSRALALPAPAPEAEYVLVSLVEEGDAASIRIECGIDIPPGSIQAA